MIKRFSGLILVALVLFALASVVPVQSESWLEGWNYRREVTISNPCGAELSGYQVQLTLGGDFDYAKAEGDGSDLRVTAADGATKIPYWVETWDPAGETASIWVKVPSIPVGGTSVYVYYGNESPAEPELVEVPPVGPWQKTADNPIVPIGDPGGGSRLLAENVVYDEDTGRYWLVFANYRNRSVGLVWSEDPGDPNGWHWHAGNPVLNSANAPHIIEHEGTWYIFYAEKGRTASDAPGYSGAYPGSYPISVAISNGGPGGPYVFHEIVLTSDEPWEAYRVDEPYVFQRNDGKWIMMYMGDAGSITEQVGYAEADSILGPYNKFDGNPAIPFGPSGSIDAGTVADPWVVEFYGTYYIGYTVSSSKSSPWRTSYVTTTDWETFVKSNEIILDLGPPGTWDDSNAFRGAVTRFGDTYYFPYTGAPSAGAYVMGIATQPAFMREQELNRCEDVFEFCDTFDDDSFDSGKWIVEQYGSGQELSESGGVLSMVALSGSRYGYVQMRGDQAVGTSTLLETRARHANAGLQCDSDADTDAAGELGFKPADMGFGQDLIRIMDYPFAEFYTIHSAAGGAMPDPRPGYTETDLPLAADWQDYAVHRTDDGYVDFWVDGTMSSVSLQPPYVPTTSLYPWLMSYAEPCAGSTTFEVDWIRVRNWCGADAAAVVGAEEALNSPPTAEAGGPYQTDEGIPVMLDASGSSDPDDNIVSHKWDLDNDGHYDDATGLTTQHTFGDDGIYTVGLQVTDDGGLVDTDEATVEVLNIAPEVSVDILEQTVQYSDGIAVVTVTATDVAADPMTAAAVGLPDDVTLADNGCSVADGSRTCTWTLSGNTDEAEGQYPVTVTVSDGDSGQTETATTINVEPEDARIRFDEGNPVSVQVTEDGGHSGPFALTIYVREAYDGMWEPNGEPEAFPGDVGLADVSMTLMPVGPGGSVPGTCTPTGVDGSGYNAWLTVVCEFDGVPVNTYVAKVTVAGGYYVGYTEDVLTVYDPSLGFTTGGGWFYWPGTTDRTNFGFTMKYNRKATKVKGSLLLIRHADDDEIYRVKSNALDGLAVGVGEGLGWASFSGKATYLEPGWTEPEGNHDFIVYVEDRNEPGRGTDRFWIEVHDKNDEVIGVLSMERYALEHAAEIEGGNIAVPH